MNTPIPDPEERELVFPQTPISAETEAHLSRAYQRILQVAIVLSVAATIITALVDWHNGLGAAIGSLLGLINFVWLHRGTEKLVNRMLKNTPADEEKAPAKSPSPRFRFTFPFPLRYLLIIGAVYVILKSYPQLIIGLMVGLILPQLASLGEGIYEAVVISKMDQTSN